MPEIAVSDDDRQAIVNYFQEGVDAQEDKLRLDSRRHEIEELYCPPYTKKQVSAVCSQVIIQTRRRLTNAALEISSEKPSSHAPIEDSTIPGEVKTSDVNGTKESSSTTKPKKIITHPKSGAWADYEHSAIKETWRRVEARFLDENVDKNPAIREKMQILCTPGIKCHLEIRRLIDLGFKPQNFTVVERDKKAWGDFEKNARELGLKPIFGELQEVVPGLKAPLDIVLLDFVNPGSDKNMSIVENLPLAPRAIVALNVLAKREKSEFQEIMGRLHKSAINKGDKAIGRQIVRSKLEEMQERMRNGYVFNDLEWADFVCKMTQEAYDKIEEHLSLDNDMSWDERETMLWYMQRYAGTLRPESWLLPNMIHNFQINPARYTNPDHFKSLSLNKQKNVAIVAAYKDLLRFFNMWAMNMISIIPDSRLMHVQFMTDLLNCITFGRRQLVSLEKFKYKSKIGKTASPFCTMLALTELPKKDYQQYQSLAHFGIKYAELFQTNSRNAAPEGNVNKKGNIQFSLMQNGQKVFSIEMLTLLNQLKHYFEDFKKKYPLSLWENQHAIPWQELETMNDV